MKLALPAIQVDASEKFVTENFSLGDERVIMNILRSKMYSSPIRTICQEVMSNARDAHREMGKGKTPIQVTLPNSIDMSLRIRDFGPGITPERMSDVFIKYGNSTKRDTNKQTGGFGLGAKSPFSYSDTFTVVSITPERGQMIRREYVAYIDESQLGAMSLVKEEKTDEEQGTTVIVPCKPNDAKKFAEAVEETGRYWTPRPKVKGNSDFCFEDVTYSYESKDGDWAIIEGDKEPRAVVDGISYRIQTALVLKDTEKTEQKLCDAGLRLFFSVGQMKVTANREDLDYQPDVITKLRAAIHKAMREVDTLVTAQMSTATNYIEACGLWTTTSNQFRWLPESCGTWNGLPLRETVKPESESYIGYREFTRGSSKPRTYKGYEARIRFQKGCLVVNNDTDSLAIARTRIDWLFANHPYVNTIQVVQEFKKPQRSYHSDDEVEKARKAFYKEMHWDKLGLIQLSQVQFLKPTYTPDGTSLNAPQVKARRMTSDGWKAEEAIDLENGKGFYVDYYKGTHILYSRKGEEVEADPEKLYSLFDEDTVIISVMRRFIPKLGKKWVPLHKKLTQMVRELREDADVRRLAGENVDSNWASQQYAKFCKPERIIDQTGTCAKLLDMGAKIAVVSKKATKLMNAAQAMKLKLYGRISARGSQFDELVNEFEAKYPLINRHQYSKEYVEDAIIYINAKDAEVRVKLALEAAKKAEREAAKLAKKEEAI